MEHTPDAQPYSTCRVAVLEGDPVAAEMLHTFFRLMEVRSFRLSPQDAHPATFRRLQVDAVVLDLDAPDLRALEIASEIERELPDVRVVFASGQADPPGAAGGWVLRKPYDRLEELLAMLEAILG